MKYKCYRTLATKRLITPLEIKKISKFKSRDDYYRILTNDGDSVNGRLVELFAHTPLQIMLGYPIVSLAIASRVVRKLFKKVTPLEVFLMKNYYRFMVQILEEK